MTFVSYNDMSQANAAGNIMQRFSDESDASTGAFQRYIEELQVKLRLRNMRQIAEEYLHKDSKILEVGCGPLDSNGKSFFTRAFPSKNKSSIFYCDCNPTLSAAFPEVICADMRNLESLFPLHSFDSVIGTNALDTLDANSLKKAFSSIRKVLKPDGKIIHSLNYEPYLYMFIGEALKHYPQAIPFLNEKGGHSVLITDSQWNHPLASILQKLDTEEKQRLWQGMLSLDKEGYFLMVAQNTTGRRIDAWPFFKTILEEICTELGFADVVHKSFSSEEIINVPEGTNWEGRCITCGPEGVSVREDKSVGSSEAKVVLQTTVTVISA